MDFVDWCIMCHCKKETMDHLLLIVLRLNSCRVWFLDLLGFNESCQDRLQILSLVGEIDLESFCLAFRI